MTESDVNEQIATYLNDIADGKSADLRLQVNAILHDIWENSAAVATILKKPQEQVFQQNADKFVDELRSVSEAEQASFIGDAWRTREVKRVDRESFALAKAYFKQPDETLVEQAQTLHEAIQRVQAALMQEDAEWEGKFGRILSESRLDVNYVLGEKRRVSLRMSKLFRQGGKRCVTT